MKTKTLIVLAGAVALLACGCSVVTVPKPMGEKPHALKTEDWEGTWISLEDSNPETMRVKVLDAVNGKLELWGVEEEAGKPTVKTYTVQIRESGDWLFASAPSDEKGQRTDSFVWARIVKRKEGLIYVWPPSALNFRKLVEEGRWKGTITNSDVHLALPEAGTLQALRSGSFGVPFDWDDPLVFRRLGSPPTLKP